MSGGGGQRKEEDLPVRLSGQCSAEGCKGKNCVFFFLVSHIFMVPKVGITILEVGMIFGFLPSCAEHLPDYCNVSS